MRGLLETKMTGRQSYFPEIIDLLVSEDEFKSGKVTNLLIVMEAFQTDLKTLIDLGPKSGLNEQHLKIIIYNSLCALKFLHSSNVVHRDIKPANILVNQDC